MEFGSIGARSHDELAEEQGCSRRSAECRVWREECTEQSVECKVPIGKCRVWSVECGV